MSVFHCNISEHISTQKYTKEYMDENNEMEVPFEPADQHISVRITTKEKRLFIKWCKELRISKSQGIRKLIVDRLASPEQIQEATDNLTDEIKELKRAISEIRKQIGSSSKPKKQTWSEAAEKVLNISDDAKVIHVPAHRLEEKMLFKDEIAVLIGCSVKTLSNIGKYVTQDGEPIFINVGKVANKGLFDCSRAHADAFAERLQVNVDWSRLQPK